MTIFRISWEFLRHKRGALTAILVLQFAQILLNLWLPSINAKIIDTGILHHDVPYVWRMGMLMLAVTLVQIFCAIGAIYFGSRTAMELGRYLRAHTFRHVQSFSATDQHRFGAPTLITRTTNDVSQVQMVTMMTFTMIVSAPIMGVGGIIMAVRQDATLSLLLLIVVPVLGAIIFSVMGALTPRYTINQQRIDRMSTLLREQLTGVRVIRAFRRQETEKDKYADANSKMRSIMLQIGLLWAFLMPSTNIVVGISSAAVVWFGGERIAAGDMQVGSLAAFISYLMMILSAVMVTGMMAMFFPRGEVSAKRIKAVLDAQPSIVAPEHPTQLPSGSLTFELDSIALQYPGAEEPVLEDLSLILSPGSTTAIIGPTGSGKSSILKLFPRLIDVTQGEVRVGGTPIRDLHPADLRSRIALVPQDAFLFSGTIASNVAGKLRADDPIDEAQVKKALEAAQAWEFVSELDEGIYSPVETGGKNLSGGQRQRITIARALYRCIPNDEGLRQAALLVFDDSFSALDFATDAKLRTGLRAAVGDIAVLIVAQRISTIRYSDAILVLENGRSAGYGTHTELMESCPTYQEIVASQLSAEEAA